MEKLFTCIVCPEGCALTVFEDGEVLKVSGNKCARGDKYGKSEFSDPRRVVTACVAVKGGRRLSVKTNAPVRKADIGAVLKAIHNTRVNPPLTIGDVVIKNVAQTGADIVATANSAERN